ncbi:MAG: LbtU family siderophore porin, partial [Gammaproteobacteria bacterium]|nr:LbtU family siderophore porin [Gammaproteobacteria bacterium]
HEDGDTEPQEVDSATVTFTDLPLAATAVMGRQYLPFGVFNSNHISDPLTLELGETREAAVYVSSGFSNTSLGVAFFNGKIHNLTESNADPNYNIDYQYSRESGSFSVGVAAYYLSNLAHAEGLFAALPTQATVSKKAPAMGLALSLGFGPAQIIAECMQAEKAFSAADFTHAGKGAKPAACQYELGYTMGKATLALGYQTTEQLLFLELPKARSLLSYSLATSDNTTIALELAQDEDYATTDGGTGKTQNIVTGQIAVSF